MWRNKKSMITSITHFQKILDVLWPENSLTSFYEYSYYWFIIIITSLWWTFFKTQTSDSIGTIWTTGIIRKTGITRTTGMTRMTGTTKTTGLTKTNQDNRDNWDNWNNWDNLDNQLKTTRTPTTGTSGITGKTIIASASTTVVGDHLKLGVVNGTLKNVALGKF